MYEWPFSETARLRSLQFFSKELEKDRKSLQKTLRQASRLGCAIVHLRKRNLAVASQVLGRGWIEVHLIYKDTILSGRL
jgi:hypothetical protein